MESIELQKPLAVANFVIEIAKEKGDPVTNLKLQKILFFLQGYCLSKHDAPLIDGSFSKWRYGPVEEDVYREFKYYGPAPIEGKSVFFDKGKIEFRSEEVRLSDKFKKEFKDVISNLLNNDAWELVNLTHEHTSWKDYQDQIVKQTAIDYTNEEIVSCFNSCKSKLGV